MLEATQLQLVVIEHEIPLADSRAIAQQLGIQHRPFFRMILKYQCEIEKDFSQLRFQNSVGDRPQGGGNPEKYALLTEDQTLAYMTYTQNTDKARACKRLLVKAFIEAKKVLARFYQTPPFPNQLHADRNQWYFEEAKVPAGHWTVFGMISLILPMLEKQKIKLPERAVLDISVGMRFAQYMREIKHINPSVFPQYRHKYPLWHPSSKAKVDAICYPDKYLPLFIWWLKTIYIPSHFSCYLKGVEERWQVAIPFNQRNQYQIC